MLGASKLLILAVTGSLLTGGALVALTGSSAGGSDRGLDTNGNERYDWLVVDMPLRAERTDYYSVYATLGTTEAFGGSCGGYGVPMPLGPTDPYLGGTPIPVGTGGMPVPQGENLYPISWASVRQFLEAGDHTVTLAFRGTDIGLAGVDGPYRVEAYAFPDAPTPDPRTGGIAPGEPYPTTAPWTYTTGAYRAAEFEQPRFAIRFTGTHTDEGVDTNGDGLFDALVLDAPADVNLAGTYSYSAMLTDTAPSPPGWYGPRMQYIASAYGTVDLAEGRQTIEVRFSGGDISASGLSGAFNFTLSVYYGGYIVDGGNVTVEPYPRPLPPTPPTPWAPGDYDVYGDTLCGVTNEYRHDQWEEYVEPATFTGAFADRGEDDNGNGRYDVLAVDVELSVTQPTYVGLSGTLMSEDNSSWIAMDWQSPYLDVGTHNVTLRFDGPSIRASGVDGPYRVDMSLYSGYRNGPTATYTTGAYAAADFDEGWGGNGTRAYWIADLRADASTISVLVQRGNDVLAYVVEDTLTVQAVGADGTVAFETQDKVYLPSGGSTQSFTYSWNPSPGTYAVVATLGNGDAVRISVTV